MGSFLGLNIGQVNWVAKFSYLYSYLYNSPCVLFIDDRPGVLVLACHELLGLYFQAVCNKLVWYLQICRHSV